MEYIFCVQIYLHVSVYLFSFYVKICIFFRSDNNARNKFPSVIKTGTT